MIIIENQRLCLREKLSWFFIPLPNIQVLPGLICPNSDKNLLRRIRGSESKEAKLYFVDI
jgi:hypothetical protein